MSKPVKVPDPVHDRLEREADERGIPMGSVIEQWMRDADRFEMVVQTGRVEVE